MTQLRKLVFSKAISELQGPDLGGRVTKPFKALHAPEARVSFQTFHRISRLILHYTIHFESGLRFESKDLGGRRGWGR